MGIIRSATVTVADPERAAALYQEWFGYRRIEAGIIDRALAESWGAPAMAGREQVLLGPASGVEIFLRLVRGTSPAETVPMRSLGWSAMEIGVEDVFATGAVMDASPFDVIGPPKPMESLPTIHPMQVRAPDGEISFLTEIKSKVPGNGLPRPAAPIDHIFIMVMGCSESDETYAWFERQLAVEPRMTMEIGYRLINEAFGLPLSNKIRLRTAKARGLVCLEFDTLPAGAVPRPQVAGELPAGIAMVSLLRADLDGVPGPWITPPSVRSGAHYAGRRAGTLRTPDGVLVEVVEG
ncbi:hypothetical protein [Niveispirillum fermenti]|uniref:hypothetical protein n=1 Tax=Niveispirillum fermenti TaxID=1233113 RepID=UPI003A874D7A